MNVNVFSGIHAGLELLKSVESAGEGEKFLRQEKYRNRPVRLLITNVFFKFQYRNGVILPVVIKEAPRWGVSQVLSVH